MTEYLRQHYQLLVMILIWVLAGVYITPLCFAVIPLSVILLKMRNMYTELLIGMIVLMVLADSWQDSMDWASDLRNIYFFMLAFLFAFNQKQFPYRNRLFYPFIPFFILAAVLLFRSPVFTTSAMKTVSFVLSYSILPFYFIKVLHEDRDRFIKGIVYAITLLLVYGFVMMFAFPDAAYLIGRYRGVMGNPNSLGMLCQVFFAFFTIVTTENKDLFPRRERMIIYGLIFLTVLMTNSRNTIFTILIFYGFYRFFRVSYLVGFVLIIVLALVNHLVISNLPLILGALGLTEYLRAETLEEGSGRLVAWEFAWNQIQYNFYFGKGIEYEGWIFSQYSEQLAMKGHIGNSHNSWLAMWLNTGLVGLILFLYGYFYRFVTFAKHTYFALPLMYAILFSATFEAWLIGSLNITVPFMLMMWSYFEVQIQDEHSTKASSPINLH